MNILFVVPYVPTVVRTRPYNLIRQLSERGHRLTVLTLWTSDEERAAVAALKAHCHRVHAIYMPRWLSMLRMLRALPAGTPLQTVFSWHPGLLASLNGDCHFDIIHVEHLRGARYGLSLMSQGETPVIWDSVDCISHLFEQAAQQSESRGGRWMTRFELKRTKRYERWLAGQFDRILITSQTDKQRLLALLPPAGRQPSITVLPNGVDLNYFRPDPAVQRKPATLVVSGKMSYHANISMAVHLVRTIMPLIWQQRPDVQVNIVGKDPARQVVALGGDPRVHVSGTVPDIRPYLQHATIAVAPITYGAGIQNKVLEAMACETPVVASAAAASALAAVSGRDLLTADEPASFAEAILTLLADPTRRRQMGRAGRAYVSCHHHWDSIAADLEHVYHATAGQQGLRRL